MGNETKPVLGSRLDPTHPQARGLRHAWILNESSGRVVTDAVTGRLGSLVGNAPWEARGAEVGVNTVVASSQYIDTNDTVRILDGAQQFTIIARVYRASSSHFCEVNRGTIDTARIGFSLYNNGRVYFVCCSTSAFQNGWITSGLTGTHTLAAVFDGTKATDATRLKGYVDGVPQTLTYDGTIGTSMATSTGTFRLGNAEYAGRSSTGSFYYALIYDRALSDAEIAAITLDPFAPWRSIPPVDEIIVTGTEEELPVASVTVEAGDLATSSTQEFPPADISIQSDDLVASSGTFIVVPESDVTLEADDLAAVITVTTATISDQNPADGATGVELLGVVTARFQPTDVGNAITTITATFDGAAVTVTVTALAGGEKEAGFPAVFVLEATHEVAWAVVTADANSNPFTSDFTVREADWSEEAVSAWAADLGWSDEFAALVVADRNIYFDELANVTSLERDVSTLEAVSISCVEGLGSGYYSDELVGLICAILEEIDSAIPLSISVAPGDSAPLALSIVVSSEREHNRHALSVNIFSEHRTSALPLSLQASDPERSTLPLSLQVGEGDESRLALSTEIEGATATPVPLELRLTNEALDAEES